MGTVISNEYETQAQTFLDRFGFVLTIERGSAKKEPGWITDKDRRFWVARLGEYCTHGAHFVITIERTAGKGSMMIPPHNKRTFDFWGSIHDLEKNLKPTPYAVLSCIGGDANGETTADAVYEEVGDIKPSQAEAIAQAARDWQAFFTGEELKAVGEIQ